MKKNLLILLSIFIFLSCNETVTEPPNADDVTTLSKKPPRPPKPDPDPPDKYPFLSTDTKHIAGISNEEVFIWETSGFTIVWSYQTDAMLPKIGFSDIDNNNSKELILLERLKGGKGRDKYDKYFLSIFEENDLEPTRYDVGDFVDYTNAIWDMKIGDIDNDGSDEIILVRRDRIEVWEFDEYYIPSLSATYKYGYYIPSVGPWEAEFVYNDGYCQGILVAFGANFWDLYKYDAGTITFLNHSQDMDGMGILNLAKAADLNDDGEIEVIGGGTLDGFLAWDWATGNHIVNSSLFPNEGWTWAFDIGDFNATENSKDIFVGFRESGIHLFHYVYDIEEGQYKFVDKGLVISGLTIQLNGILVMNADGVAGLEIIVASSTGLHVYGTDYNAKPVENRVVGFLDDLTCK